MSHRTAGTIGTLVLGAVAVLSYVTAFQYFSAPRLEDGTFATLIPLQLHVASFLQRPLHFDLGILLDPISVMMLIVISTVSLMVHIYSFRLHERRSRFSALLRFPVPVYDVYAGTGCCHKHFPDVSFLGTGGVSSYLLIGFIIQNRLPSLLPRKRLLLLALLIWVSDRYPDLRLLWWYIRIYPGHGILDKRWSFYAPVGSRIDVCRWCR